MDASGGVFQVRPHKEFNPARGRDRIFSLQLFSEMPSFDFTTPAENDEPRNGGSSSSSGPPRNAARSAQDGAGSVGGNRWIDPSVRTWSSHVRINNYTAIETSPLCVRDLFVHPGFLSH